MTVYSNFHVHHDQG